MSHTGGPFTPNWQRLGYKNKQDAILHSIGDVLDKVPGSTIILGKKVYTNIPESRVYIKRAKYCPKHGKILMGKKYLCGCKYES